MTFFLSRPFQVDGGKNLSVGKIIITVKEQPVKFRKNIFFISTRLLYIIQLSFETKYL